MGGWERVCVFGLVGVNKSGGTKANGSRSALKRMLAEQELSVQPSTAHCPPIKKVPVCWNKRAEAKIHLIITEDTGNLGNKTNCKNIFHLHFVTLHNPHPACRWSHSDAVRRSPSSSGRAQWKWCQTPRYAGVSRQEAACPLGTDRNTCLQDRKILFKQDCNRETGRLRFTSNTPRCTRLTSHLSDLPAVCDSWLGLCWLAEWWLSLFWSWGCTPGTASVCWLDYTQWLNISSGHTVACKRLGTHGKNLAKSLLILVWGTFTHFSMQRASSA